MIPATDSPPTLGRCLEAVRRAERPPDEVIVVSEPARAGPAEARNRGSRRAGGELIAFVDADVLVHPDAFARIRAAFEQEPTLTALFGSYDDAPEAPGAVSGFRNLLHHHVHQQGAGEPGTFWAGLGAVRREPFLAAGGFDSERYPEPSIEDVELGMRLAARGARMRLDPMLQGTHLKHWSLTQMVCTDYLRRGVPWARLVLSSGRAPAVLNLGWRHRLSAVASLSFAAAVAMRRPRVAAAALLSLIALNAGFYRLVWRRRGPSEAAASVGLHALHHLVGAASALAVAVEAVRARLAGVPPDRQDGRGARRVDQSGTSTDPRSATTEAYPRLNRSPR